MSQENVERLERVIDHANATGRLGPEFDVLIHPRVKFEDEIRAFLEGFAEAIGGLRLEVKEVRDLGETIVVVVLQSGLGAASGVPVEQPFTWVMVFDNNSCIQWRIFA